MRLPAAREAELGSVRLGLCFPRCRFSRRLAWRASCRSSAVSCLTCAFARSFVIAVVAADGTRGKCFQGFPFEYRSNAGHSRPVRAQDFWCSQPQLGERSLPVIHVGAY